MKNMPIWENSVINSSSENVCLFKFKMYHFDHRKQGCLLDVWGRAKVLGSSYLVKQFESFQISMLALF